MPRAAQGSPATQTFLRSPDWYNEFSARFGEMWIEPLAPGLGAGGYVAQTTFSFYGSVAVGSSVAATDYRFRPNGRDGFAFLIHAAGPNGRFRLGRRELELGAGGGLLVANDDTGAADVPTGARDLAVWMPRRRWLEVHPQGDRRRGQLLDGGSPILSHLLEYIPLLLSESRRPIEPDLGRHVETTLLDLVALAVGGAGDATEVAVRRGLRAARLRLLLGEIASGFRDPGFSVEQVAARLRLSPRYIQDLLHESGATFTERVREHRLQAARRLLENYRFDSWQVSQIAFEVGFNDISHFNHCFRRQFGASPRAVRKDGLH